MKFIIQKEIFENFDGLTVGFIIAKNIDNRGQSPEINGLLRSVEKKVTEEFSGFASPSEHPNIIPWRQAYKKFGSDPHDFRCSSEALVRQVLKGNEIRHINKLVDIYNYISLKYVVTVGGEDIEKTKGDIVLGFALGDEPFTRLGGEENEPPSAGEVIYKDELGVLCRRWNWWEADRTKLTEETKNAIIVIEGLPPMGNETISPALSEMAELFKKLCFCEVSIHILNKDNQEIDIS
ncbi:MAG: phenylalanine--tRNA ligase beta subunit-related protein [bacterium]